MRNTKVILLMMVILMSLSLVACGPDKKAQEPKAEVKQEEVKKEEPKKEQKPVEMAALMQNTNFRLAIAHAIEKSYIEDTILNDGSVAVNYYVTKGSMMDADGKDFREKYPDGFLGYDLAKAQEYWAKCKEELGFDKVTVRLLTYDQESRKKVSEYVQAQLTKNLEGLTITLDVQPFKNKLQMAREGNFDIEMSSYAAPYADPMSYLEMFSATSAINMGKYKQDDIQAIFDSATTGELTKDPKKRWEALQEAEKTILSRDAQSVPLYQTGESFLQNKEVKGLVLNSSSPTYYYADATTDRLIDGKKLIRMIIAGDVPTLNTIKANDNISFTTIGNVMEGLARVDNDNIVKPQMAEKWEISEDYMTYTFHLRKNAKWSNGSPVTAHDYVFAWKMLTDPENAASMGYFTGVAGIKNAKAINKKEMPVSELGVKALDDYTLQVQLEVATPYFLRMTAIPLFYPINEKFYNEHKETYGTSKDDTLYCGPYIITKLEAGYGYTLEKNPNYYNKDAVKNDIVTGRVVKDVAAGVNMYIAGDVDRCQLSGEYVEKYRDKEEFEQVPVNRITYLVFNQHNRK